MNYKVKDLLKEFKSLFKNKKYKDLEISLEKFLKKNSENTEALLLYSIVCRRLMKFADAEKSIIKLINLEPENPYFYSVYGELLFNTGLNDVAKTMYKKSLELDQDFVFSLFGLSQVYERENNFEKAIFLLERAINLDKNFFDAKNLLALIYKKNKSYKKALHLFQEIKDNSSLADQLECLYYLNDRDNFFTKLNIAINQSILSPKIASLSSHASIRYNQTDNYSFCKDPLNFIYKKNLLQSDFLNESLIDDLLVFINQDSNIFRKQKLLKNGKQTAGNLFLRNNKSIQSLLEIIKNEIKIYKKSFRDSCDMINLFPKNFSINGWAIKIQNEGHLDSHIHENGWLSGSVYLEMPKNIIAGEGDIVFSLHGGNYPVENKKFPEMRLSLKTGDIVIFPSSLFHSTTPIKNNLNRISIAFDLVPI